MDGRLESGPLVKIGRFECLQGRVFDRTEAEEFLSLLAGGYLTI